MELVATILSGCALLYFFAPLLTFRCTKAALRARQLFNKPKQNTPNE